MFLQLAVGPVLTESKGYAAPETKRAYARARELCEQAGDPPEFFPALFGLYTVYLIQGDLRMAYELAEQLLRRAQDAQDPALLPYAHFALGDALFWMGLLDPARENFETAICLCERKRDWPLTFRFPGSNTETGCLSYAAWTLWHLGYPNQALMRINEALGFVQKQSHPFSLALAKYFLAVLCQYRGEVQGTQETAESLIALSAEYGLTYWLGHATILYGWSMAKQGHNENAIAQIQGGLAALRQTGAEIRTPYFLCLLAEACREADHLNDGLL